jgi:GT2 family glycosyltransferase
VTAAAPRVLFTIAVYNGREFMDRTLQSAAAIDRTGVDVDILVLDDASPAPGFSDELAEACAARGFLYYRSPRNQGLVRSLNVAMRWAQREQYDHVILANSDVIYPANLVVGMVTAAESDPRCGAVVSWSNNASAFSLLNHDPDVHLPFQDVVDTISRVCRDEFDGATLEIPCANGFCWLIPVPVLDRVGVHDTVFGRGYCEETDWSLRARAAGYKVLLALSVFTYHQGNGSMIEAGVLQGGEKTIDAHEAVIDMRYPDFRDEVQAFADTGLLQDASERAVRALVRGGLDARGYDVEVGWLAREPEFGARPHCFVHPGSLAAHIEISYLGFRRWVTFDDGDGPGAIRAFFGADPARVLIRDIGPQADRVERAFGGDSTSIDRRVAYPQSVV